MEVQVRIAEKHIEELNREGTERIEIIDRYIDLGKTGSNFERDEFQRLMQDIRLGDIDCVVVKDLSRFGRNYLEVGLYTEIRFPEMGVRFIAVNDGVDSDDQMGNDFTPFRNIINEWYAKDTSKKIRAVFRNKGMSGQRLAVNAPYGYIKGEDGHLLVDEETAPVVELIFQLCVEGNGPGKIARMLKEREIPTPGTITFQRTGQTSRYFPDDPCRWNAATVQRILEQDTYLGRTTNFKTTKLSYKSKKTVINSPDKWAVFEGTHEAIIDKETWEIVQKSREHRRRPTKMGEMGLFSGLAYCADCDAKLYHHRSITLTKRAGELHLLKLPVKKEMYCPLYPGCGFRTACTPKSPTCCCLRPGGRERVCAARDGEQDRRTEGRAGAGQAQAGKAGAANQ